MFHFTGFAYTNVGYPLASKQNENKSFCHRSCMIVSYAPVANLRHRPSKNWILFLLKNNIYYIILIARPSLHSRKQFTTRPCIY